VSFRHGPIELLELEERAVMKLVDRLGRVVCGWVGRPDPARRATSSPLTALPSIPTGEVEVAEVNWTMAVCDGRAPGTCHTLQKFSRGGGG
jgi:hypothetical protein